MINRSWKMVAAAGAVALALSLPALAGDNDDSWGWGQGWGMGHMMGGWWGGNSPGYDGQDSFLDHVDGRLAFIKAELKISDAQEPAWNALASAVHEAADTHKSLMQGTIQTWRSGDLAKMPLPDRLKFQRGHMEAMLKEIDDVSGALDKLYAALTDDQKKTADSIVLPMMGMGMGSGGFGSGMGPGYGHGWGSGFWRGWGPGMMRWGDDN